MKIFMSRTAWRTLFAGPLRVRVTIEKPDGTELYYFYPLGSQSVEYGQTVHVDFEVGVKLEEA